ncbi:hypothetical protein [Paraflavitalea pollutisoli]|uniref:hypothetical protein n=1 Tax=Paraflavitalea pollutisoli TaxID=3034143 RepID=UPI0023ED7FBA|nr:hypothetical protein [Paraflavitalea sp. H1-2-19X]
MTSGLIAIKGDHIDQLTTIFGFFNLTDTGKEEVLTSWEAAENIIDDEYMNPADGLQRRIVWVDNGWTIIEDYSFLLCMDEEAMATVSRTFKTPVFSLQTIGTSGCYGFHYYHLEKLRSFFNEDGKVVDNFGKPLPEETGYNFNTDAFYDDIHGLARNLGINLDNAANVGRYIVKHLSDNTAVDFLAPQSLQQQQPDHTAVRKPWWKIW